MTTGQQEQAERRMLGLLRASGLPEPDEVEHGEHCVRFLWDEQRVAVVVDLEDGEVSQQ